MSLEILAYFTVLLLVNCSVFNLYNTSVITFAWKLSSHQS